MRLLLPLCGLFAYVVMSPAAQRTNPVLTGRCSLDRMPVYRPDLSRIERMPILRPDTLKIEKMPIVRAFCTTNFRLAPTDTNRAHPRLLP
jgi:hypothetical protein